jgi:hypothetical protein
MAALTKVDICNMALSHIGARNDITTFPTASSTGIENQSLFLWYDISRRQLLEAYNWTFARQLSAILTDHADDPDDTEGLWSYRYVVPTDHIKIREVLNPTNIGSNAIPYEISMSRAGGSMSIQSNVDDMQIIYTFDNEDPSTWSEYFAVALSHLLAANIAFPITRKRSVMGDQMGLYRQMLSIAAAHDANEEVDDAPRDADWIRGRGVSPYLPDGWINRT